VGRAQKEEEKIRSTMNHNQSSLHEFVFTLALVLFFVGAFPYPFGPSPTFDPWRGRLVSAGLFCWALSTIF
jgi:hypothetical protein